MLGYVRVTARVMDRVEIRVVLEAGAINVIYS